MNMQWVKRTITNIHLWAGLILGLQLIIWMMSGVVMSWFHIDDVRGTTTASELPAGVIADGKQFASLGSVLAKVEQPITISLKMGPAGPLYLVEGKDEEISVFDAQSGEKIDRLDEAIIRQVALDDFTGKGDLVSLEWQEKTAPEYRGPTPVWLAQFNDYRHTRLYIDPALGQVRSRRNDIWRLYDFFWMLHIMDYDERENFNNPLIRIAAASGLIFALSGLGLVIFRLSAGRYYRRKPKKKGST